MLEEILGYLNNWFVPDGGIHIDTYAIEDGSISLPFLSEGQYFRIVGSTFNDGVYKYPHLFPKNETFHGAVWAMALPPSVLTLVSDIEAWQEKYGKAAESPYVSESFAGYTYTKSGGYNSEGGVNNWVTAFKIRLAQWRRL